MINILVQQSLGIQPESVRNVPSVDFFKRRLKMYCFYHVTACNAMYGIAVAILSFCLSICLSVIYPCFFEFFHVDIQSTGHTLSRPWLRQPNDVRSEIECAQLHNELFGHRHSTVQSRGLFALAKHL